MLKRHLEAVVADRLAEEPVVVVTGARRVGKSTLLAACGRAHGVQALDLDDVEARSAVRTDPALFVAADRPQPVCIDEFQHELRLLDAIKAELNRDLRAGRYLLTGSTRYSTLPGASQSLTGRAHVITMWPLSQGELAGRQETALDLLVSDPAALVSGEPSTTQRQDYERLILAGGFPLALARPEGTSRSRWFRDFLDMVIQRDVLEIRKIRQRQVMPLILRHLAAQTGQVLKASTIANALELDARLVGDMIPPSVTTTSGACVCSGTSLVLTSLVACCSTWAAVRTRMKIDCMWSRSTDCGRRTDRICTRHHERRQGQIKT